MNGAWHLNTLEWVVLAAGLVTIWSLAWFWRELKAALVRAHARKLEDDRTAS